MQTYSIVMKIVEIIEILFCIIILICILTYFAKEEIKYFKRGKISSYDSQKEIQRKIKREQLKVEKLMDRGKGNGRKSKVKRNEYL